MDAGVISLVLFALLLSLLASGLWVAPTLLAVGFVALAGFSSAPAGSLLASTVWDASWNWALTALPLFVWMGEILFRTRLSSDMFNGLAPWVARLPGGLLHVNIVGCGVMAAVAGSSAVTCATVGRMSMPELRRRGYDQPPTQPTDGRSTFLDVTMIAGWIDHMGDSIQPACIP